MTKARKNHQVRAALSRRESFLGILGSTLISFVAGNSRGAMAAAQNSDAFTVPSRVVLRTLTGVAEREVHLTEPGREGHFIWNDSDLSAQVAADEECALFVPPNSDSTGGSGAWVRQVDGPVLITWFGAVGDGATDDTMALVHALNAIENEQTLDLQGLHLNIFVGITGSASGDAISLAQTPRLFGKKDVTIQNGRMTADSPEVSDTKLRYPSTLTIDGCENVTLRNLIVHSKGENYGDTDASSGLSKELRRAFMAQNGGHAIVVIRSRRTAIINCQARLCGSVGSVYIVSSHETALDGVFSNPGSLGYAAYAFDSWAGDASVSGYPAHVALMTDCSASRENYLYGSKGCVLTEDADVSVAVSGGYFADAYPNGNARDLGYAFGCSSSRTIVENATVENCASIGYTATTTKTDYSYLYITNVHALGLRKTVHQTEATGFGRMNWAYRYVKATVTGGGTWAEDPDLSRKATSYLAMPNGALRLHGLFDECDFTGATYGIVSTHSCYGRLRWQGGAIETKGFLWDSANIGGGAPGYGAARGIQFDRVTVTDISNEMRAYCTTVSNRIYTYIDLTSSTIKLSSARPLDARRIADPRTFIEHYSFPQPQVRRS